MDNVTIDIIETIESVTIAITDELNVSVSIVEAHDGIDGKTIQSASFIGDDIVFVNNDLSEVVLTDAKIELKGDQGDDGREIEIQKNATHIQWRYVGDLSWTDLVLLSDLKGVKGDDGLTPVKGVDYFDGIDGEDGTNGKSVEIQNSGNYIQWRLIGDVTWINIIALSALKGDKGDDGLTPVKGVDYFDGTNGTDGREVEFNKSVTHIQWRYVGETVWINLVLLDDIKGNDGYTPIKGVDYFDGADGISWEAFTFNTTLNFGNNQRLVYATIADTTMTLTKIIQCFYTDKLDEVAILNMRVSERNRTAGVGFDIVGVAPDGASGIYPVRIITSGA